VEDGIIELENIPDIFPLRALEWSKSLNGFWNGMADTPVEKAVSCLMHAFDRPSNRQDTYSVMLWSLAGLEALLCDSSSSILYQIRRRAPLLGNAFNFKNLDNLISKGYNFRSRLFHGNVRIRNPIVEDDNMYDLKTYYESDADKYANFFLTLLSCALISCLQQGRLDIHFNEMLSG